VNRTAGNTAHTGNALGRIGNGEVIVGDGSHGAFPCAKPAGNAIGIDSGNQPGPLRFAVVLSGNWRAGIGAGSEFFEDLLAENGQLLAIGIVWTAGGKFGQQTVCRNGRNCGNGLEPGVPGIVFHLGKGVIKHLREAYPEANIVAVDYDPGASEVNQVNRIKLMLAAANKNMKK